MLPAAQLQESPRICISFCIILLMLSYIVSYFFYTSQDLDKIAEANELFDAVLTGSVNQDKNTTTTPNVPPPKMLSATETCKSTETQKGVNSLRRLSIYIGNFPWVSDIFSILLTSHVANCFHLHGPMMTEQKNVIKTMKQNEHK